MNTCPDTGALRGVIDDEAAEGVAAHAAGCGRCAAELTRLRAGAAFAAGALALLAPPGERHDAPAVLAPSVREEEGLAGRRRRGRRLSWDRWAAAAAVLVLLAGVAVFSPTGREAAASFLAQFRSERITVVTLDPFRGLDPMMGLAALGALEADAELATLQFAGSVAEAERRVGFAVVRPDRAVLPERFPPDPQVGVFEAQEVRLVLDADRVRGWLQEHGAAEHPVPAGLDGAALVVRLPAAVLLTYHSPDGERLVVAQSEQVTAHAEGDLGLEELREFLLALPGMPEDTVRQLRAIDDWRNTLPLPLPADRVDWRDVDLADTPAVALEAPSGFAPAGAPVSAVLWQRGGFVHGVGGLVDADTARRIAEALAR
jgi:hypothetical protein